MIQRDSLIRYAKAFWFAIPATITALILVWVYLGPAAAVIATLLIILEITFSFENAVINAKVLQHMSTFWQKIFLTIGILVAVFGMRIVFPIAVVAISAQLPFNEVLNLALNDPEQYSQELEEAQIGIAAFGGMFLLMVFLSYFIIENGPKFWLARVERVFKKLPPSPFIVPGLAFAILLVVASLLARDYFSQVLSAGALGIVTYSVVHGLVGLMQQKQDRLEHGAKLVGFGGFIGFMYLEILDASFSFDGVIGAFAITSSVILIAAGLGVGALWVRSLTIYLVRHQTLAKYAYLEQGAHYAIGILALVLLLSFSIHLPEFVTGLLGVSVIAASVVASRKHRRAKLE